jgi:hypothetical protein
MPRLTAATAAFIAIGLAAEAESSAWLRLPGVRRVPPETHPPEEAVDLLEVRARGMHPRHPPARCASPRAAPGSPDPSARSRRATSRRRCRKSGRFPMAARRRTGTPGPGWGSRPGWRQGREVRLPLRVVGSAPLRVTEHLPCAVELAHALLAVGPRVVGMMDRRQGAIRDPERGLVGRFINAEHTAQVIGHAQLPPSVTPTVAVGSATVQSRRAPGVGRLLPDAEAKRSALVRSRGTIRWRRRWSESRWTKPSRSRAPIPAGRPRRPGLSISWPSRRALVAGQPAERIAQRGAGGRPQATSSDLVEELRPHRHVLLVADDASIVQLVELGQLAPRGRSGAQRARRAQRAFVLEERPRPPARRSP